MSPIISYMKLLYLAFTHPKRFHAAIRNGADGLSAKGFALISFGLAALIYILTWPSNWLAKVPLFLWIGGIAPILNTSGINLALYPLSLLIYTSIVSIVVVIVFLRSPLKNTVYWHIAFLSGPLFVGLSAFCLFLALMSFSKELSPAMMRYASAIALVYLYAIGMWHLRVLSPSYPRIAVIVLLSGIVNFFTLDRAVFADLRITRTAETAMYPNVNQGDWLVGIRQSGSKPKICDVVFFGYPGDDNWRELGRVLAMPGDLIRIGEGSLNINNSAVRRTYLTSTKRSPPFSVQQQISLPDVILYMQEIGSECRHLSAGGIHAGTQIAIQLGEDEYFIVGDDWTTLSAGHDFAVAVLPEAAIKEQVLGHFWPVGRKW